MHKLMIAVLLALLAGLVEAAPTADLKLAEDGNRLYCNARVQGIEGGQVVKVTFRWTAPDARFVSSEYTPEKALGDASSKARCYCQDTGEKGCQRTRAYRTVEYKNTDGKNVRARGTWKVELLDEAGNILGAATYEIK
jgi:hypothetical protein